MKDYLKNLFAARGAAFWLNLLGLSLAFVIFYVLMAEVKWVHDYDRCYQHSDRIYQVRRQLDTSNDMQNLLSVIYNMATTEDIATQCPAIEYATAFDPTSNKILFSDSEHPDKTPISIGFMKVSPDFAHVFGLDIVEGDTTLSMKGVLAPLSFVKKLFGEQESYVGRTMLVGQNKEEYAVVNGVYRDLPDNASIGNHVYLAMGKDEFEDWKKQTGAMNFMLFVRLHKGASPEGMFDHLELPSDWSYNMKEAGFREVVKMAELSDSTAGSKLVAMPIGKICFMPSVFNFGGGCNQYTYWLYIVLAMLIVFIASINYMNFAMAMIPYRIKEINIRKIFGERTCTIRLRMMSETFLLGTLAFLFALFILWVVVQNGFMDTYMQCDLALAENLPVLGILFLVAMSVPLLASVYPTWYTTSRKPALVINGNFALSENGRTLRHALVGVQFSLSLLVVIILLLMNAQHYYIRHAPVGYARDSILYVKPVLHTHDKELKIRLKEHPAVMGMAGCDNPIGTSDVASVWGREIKGQQESFRAYTVDVDFMKVMGIPIIAGRDFREEDKRNTFIFNESARLAFGLTDVEGENADFVGIIPDIQTFSFRKEIVPTGFALYQGGHQYYILRIDSPKNFREVTAYVKNVIQDLYGSTDGLEIFTADEALDNTYEEENKQTNLLLIGSVTSLLISLIGVFGLVLFETRAKRKEIGIRKVFGATTKGILVMFNMQYLRTLAMCFIIAAPVAYTLYNKWIESFAYRTPVHWWLFAVAFLIVAIVVCLTVTVQSWRAAKERPVETIMK